MESELPRIVQKASESHFSWTKFKCKTVLKMLKFCAFVKISYFMNNCKNFLLHEQFILCENKYLYTYKDNRDGKTNFHSKNLSLSLVNRSFVFASV